MDPTYQEVGALNNQPTSLDYLQGVKFKVVLQKCPNVSYFCQKVNIPGFRMQSAQQPTPYVNVPLPGQKVEFEKFRMSFFVDVNWANYLEIANWIFGLGQIKNANRYANLKKENILVNSEFGGLYSDITVHALDNQSNAKMRFMIRQAFPVSMSEVEFDATEENPQPKIVTAEFEYTYFDICPST